MKNEHADVSIELAENGPLIVKGLKSWRNSKGQQLQVKESMALCRCGASANKPYCDGSHATVGFSGQREISQPLRKERAYKGEKIAIHDNRVICSHAAECVDKLSAVFQTGRRPWIDPDAAEVESVIEIVKRCPSGALSYTLDGTHHRDQDGEPAIDIAKDGPYNISGGIRLNVEEALQPPSKEHYSLCRCGASKNKPYCDGAHHDIEFRDEKN